MRFIPEDLRPYFKLSLGFHLGIFIFFGVKVLLFPDLSDLNDQSTLKVDLVALPDKDDNKKVPEKIPEKPEEKKPVAKKEEPPKEKPKVEETKTKTQVVKKEEPKKNTEADAFAKLREMEALKNLENKKETVKTAEPVIDTPIKGNRLAPGDALIGLNKLQYNNYINDLQKAVKSKWDLPPWLQDGELSAEALIKIDQSGLVTEQTLIRPSGNSIYDKYVLDTINKSSPFPPPPDKFVNVVAIKGVVLSFN